MIRAATMTNMPPQARFDEALYAVSRERQFTPRLIQARLVSYLQTPSGGLAFGAGISPHPERSRRTRRASGRTALYPSTWLRMRALNGCHPGKLARACPGPSASGSRLSAMLRPRGQERNTHSFKRSPLLVCGVQHERVAEAFAAGIGGAEFTNA